MRSDVLGFRRWTKEREGNIVIGSTLPVWLDIGNGGDQPVWVDSNRSEKALDIWISYPRPPLLLVVVHIYFIFLELALKGEKQDQVGVW